MLRRSKIARFSNIMILCTFSVSRSFHEKNQKTYDISQGKFMSYNLLCILAISSIFLLVVESWNRQHHGQTEKFNSMNLFKILCVVTWAQLFLTSMVLEAVRGQKRYRERTLWHFKLNVRYIPRCQFCLPKMNKKHSPYWP